MTIVTKAILVGYLAHAIQTALVQDLMGLEQYVQYLEAVWVEIHPLVWLIAIIPMFYYYRTIAEQDSHRDTAVFTSLRAIDVGKITIDVLVKELKTARELLKQNGLVMPRTPAPKEINEVNDAIDELQSMIKKEQG